MSKALQVSINMRPYPQEKPPKWGSYEAVGTNGRQFYYFGIRHGIDDEPKWYYHMNSAVANVTHFALPSDITTTDAVRGGKPMAYMIRAKESSDIYWNEVCVWPNHSDADDEADILNQDEYEGNSDWEAIPLGVLPFDGVTPEAAEAYQAVIDWIENLREYAILPGTIAKHEAAIKTLIGYRAALSHLPPATPRKGEG